MFLGFAVVYGLRVNLSVAMVAMVNGTSAKPNVNGSETKECPASSGTLNSSNQSTDEPDGVRVFQFSQHMCRIISKMIKII